MQERATPALRWARALLLAAVAFGLGLVGHLAAGGLVPGPTGLLALYAATAAACAALLGRAASTLRITALVVAGQAAIHTVLTAASGHTGDAHATGPATGAATTHVADPVATTADRSGSLVDAYRRASEARGAADGLAVPDWAQHLVDDLTGPHAAMALAHLVVAAAVGLWLASGERALWAVLRLTRSALAGTLARLVAALDVLVVGAPPSAAAGADRGDVGRLHSALLASSQRRRGPPALLAA